ncbi:MAG: hypothetical protein P8X57_03035, partial [Cyclobacteriaceae bacterium]
MSLQKSFIQRSFRYLMLAIMAAALLGGTGCKSKKKAAEAAAAAEERARLEREMEEKRLAEEEARRRAEEERLAAERARAEAAEKSPERRLNRYFDAIAASGSSSSIREAMSLFASPETPVLIVISEQGGVKDYDRPTNISEYLNYLKDTG